MNTRHRIQKSVVGAITITLIYMVLRKCISMKSSEARVTIGQRRTTNSPPQPITFFKKRQLFVNQLPPLLPPLSYSSSLSFCIPPSLRRPLRAFMRWSEESWKLNYASQTDKSSTGPFRPSIKATTRLLSPCHESHMVSLTLQRLKRIIYLIQGSHKAHFPY